MRKTAILILTLLAASAAFADTYSDTYVIPIVGHTNGAGGTKWMSDLAIRNFSNSPMTVELVLIESGNNYADNIGPLITEEIDGSVTVAANASVLLRDILAGYDPENIAGALIVGSDRPFAVTSRAYNDHLPLGQTVPATSDFFTNSTGTIDNEEVVYIPGIMHNARTRTNVGFAAGSGGSFSEQMVVAVTIRNAAGTIVGTRSFFIPPGNFAHYQFNIGSIIGANAFDVGTAEFRITQGEGTVVPYASLIDNVTSEAAYIMGQFPDSTPLSAKAFRPFSLFRQLLNRQTR